MKRMTIKILTSGFICCFLILGGCSKKDKMEDIDNTPEEHTGFDPARSFIAGTMYFNMRQIVSPYAIYLDPKTSQATVFTIADMEEVCPYTLKDKILTIDYNGVQLSFDLNTVQANGEIKVITSSVVQKITTNYAVIQKSSPSSVFLTTFADKLVRGDLTSFEDFSTATAGPCTLSGDVHISLPSIQIRYNDNVPAHIGASVQLTNDVLLGSSGNNAIYYLFVHINDYMELGVFPLAGYSYICRLKMVPQIKKLKNIRYFISYQGNAKIK